MGTQKLLLPVGGRPLIARVVDEVLRSGVRPVLVVVGRHARRLERALMGRRVKFVTNPRPESDMLESVRCGLRALPKACAAVAVVLGDQPGLTAETLASLIRAYRAGTRDIVVPTCQGRRGHPLLFARRYGPEVLSGYASVGLRGLLQAHPEDVFEVELGAPAVLEDMDLPADYRRVVSRFGLGPQNSGRALRRRTGSRSGRRAWSKGDRA